MRKNQKMYKEEVQKMLKNSQKGITLIALVITIIVLLILAGVAISQITGNSSILQKAQNASDETRYAEEESQVNLAVVSAIANSDDGLGTLTIGKLQDELVKYGIPRENVVASGTGWKVTGYTGREFTISESGKVTPGTKPDSPANPTAVATTYTVTYNANGGSGSIANGSGASITLANGTSLTAPTTGNLFVCWNTAADGTGTDYQAGATVTADLNLYAKWTKNISTAIASATQYGEYINLGTNLLGSGVTSDWRIFYKDTSDSNKVYAILTDYLPNSTNIAKGAGFEQGGVHGTQNFNAYGVYYMDWDVVWNFSENENWKNGLFNNSTLAENDKYGTVTAIGAITADTLLASYNAKYNKTGASAYTLKDDNNQIFNNNNNQLDDLYVRSLKDDCRGYFLATWADSENRIVWSVRNTGKLGIADSTYPADGLRPAVILPSNLQVYKDGNGVWQIQ